MSWTLSNVVIVPKAIGDPHFITFQSANYDLYDGFVYIIMADGLSHSNTYNKIHSSVLAHKTENMTFYKSINCTGMFDILVKVKKIYF